MARSQAKLRSICEIQHQCNRAEDVEEEKEAEKVPLLPQGVDNHLHPKHHHGRDGDVVEPHWLHMKNPNPDEVSIMRAPVEIPKRKLHGP